MAMFPRLAWCTVMEVVRSTSWACGWRTGHDTWQAQQAGPGQDAHAASDSVGVT